MVNCIIGLIVVFADHASQLDDARASVKKDVQRGLGLLDDMPNTPEAKRKVVRKFDLLKRVAASKDVLAKRETDDGSLTDLLRKHPVPLLGIDSRGKLWMTFPASMLQVPFFPFQNDVYTQARQDKCRCWPANTNTDS
jgi:hypothetical protein